MILFSPAKINIGLQVLRKRPDGFHEISSLMLPIPFYDILEMVMDHQALGNIFFNQTGLSIPVQSDTNICLKAIRLYNSVTGLSRDVRMHLHKQIPVGAGLGGGSSNASSVLLGINQLNQFELKQEQLSDLAAQLGSDCPLFIYEQPMLVSGRGEILEKTPVTLSGYYLVLVNPGIYISTAEAYAQVSPERSHQSLKELLKLPVFDWKDQIRNDFEDSLFPLYPSIGQLKADLYNSGAIYASMSGSGSSLYGIFEKEPALQKEIEETLLWRGWL